MKLLRGPLTGAQTGTMQSDTVLRGTQLSIRHSALSPPSKGLSPSLSPARATILPTAKQPILPPLLSTNTLALLWTPSPIWRYPLQRPLPNFLDLLRYNHEGE